MIHVIVDLHHVLHVPENAHQVITPGDYVAARTAVRIALDEQRDLTVYVTNLGVAQWLSDLRRYPTTVVDWRDVRPSMLFEEIFGMAPPAVLTDALLVTLDLETLRRPAMKVSDPIAYILGQRLDPLWSYVEPPSDHFAHVVLWAAPRRDWQPGTLITLVQHTLQRWAATDRRYAELSAERLPADSQLILTHSALHNYDSAWQQQQPWSNKPVIDITNASNLVAEILRPIHTVITTYWNQTFATYDHSLSGIELALSQMSGLSVAELDAVAWFFEQQPTLLSASLFSKIQTVFSHLDESQSYLHRLQQLIIPETPCLPDATWSTDRWLRWASKDYMPYFAWLIRSHQARDHQIACARAFSNWMYEHYPRWCNDDHSPLARQQHGIVRDLLANDPRAVVVWLVLDGMAWWHGETFASLCEKEGLYIQEHRALISALPSITRIAKRALVTGVSTTDIAETTIRAAATAHFTQVGVPTCVTYRMREAVAAIRDGEVRCVIVLDNTIDDTSHSIGEFTNTQATRGHFLEILEALSNISRACASQGRRLHIVIGSDHGSTLIPSNAHALPLPKRVKTIEELWEGETSRPQAEKHSARAATMEELTNLTPAEKEDWFILDRDRFQLEQHYVVPRDYNYIKPRPSGWTHGGLTPEEVIVPMLHLAPEAPHVVEPQVILMGTLSASSEAHIEVEVRNLNRFALEQLVLNIVSIEPSHIEDIAPLSSSTFSTQLPPATSTTSQEIVSWRIDYRAFGVAYVLHGQAPLTVRRLSTTESNDFDDMFDDL